MAGLKIPQEEGSTPISDASGLIPPYITNQEELNNAEFLNISKATKYYLANKKALNNFEITRENLFEVHKKMFSDVWEWAGKKRKSNKNIGVEPYKIDEEIKKFVDDYSYWIKEKWGIIKLITYLHHRLVWIHPFEGGNGRWSRLVANIIYYKSTKSQLKFPINELKLKSSIREEYLKALKEGDKGDFVRLISFFNRLTK